ncbi:hypothetical protein [Mycobacterium sp. DL592]|uniref:hypothetical protein n=1 Tax=Mycobacterium sp. DL592 TaxID=2675524 RepID=UPI001FBA5DE9|nr:hypothetical protein [Mycobacterium sp. DL592]
MTAARAMSGAWSTGATGAAGWLEANDPVAREALRGTAFSTSALSRAGVAVVDDAAAAALAGFTVARGDGVRWWRAECAAEDELGAESVESADAIPAPLASAPPMPSAIARPPIRPR